MPYEASFGAPILTPINHPIVTFFSQTKAALESVTQDTFGISWWLSILLGFLLIVDVYFILWIFTTSRRYPTMVGLRYLKAQQSGGLSVITSIAVMRPV